MYKHIFRQTCCKLLVVLNLSILSFCNNNLFQFFVAKWLSFNCLFYSVLLFYLISVIHLCVKDVSVGLLRQCTCLLYFSRNSSENSGNSLMGDDDNTEILVTETTIQTVNTDDLGIQTSKEAISQLPNQSETVIPVEEKSETPEEKQIIAGKMIGTNDLTTTIVIFIVILNYHRHSFLKIRMEKD